MSLLDDWTTWRRHEFPRGIAGTEIDGIDVTSVDSFAAGCIQTFFDRGTLDEKRISVLEGCIRDLQRALPQFSGPAEEYFGELLAIARAVLAGLGRT
jgi:hypothetical protein